MKEVLILFKTHLDVGFTDLSEKIFNKYINEYIPNAIKVGYELKDTDTPFIWTLGSWMVYQALKRDTDGTVEKAIKDGIISWHALPFTTHTETMSTELFEYGLDLCTELDKRFGKKTIGSKMTDVPGHTLGIIPLMAKRGVKFMHLGVNPATPIPPVPPVFRWKNGDDEITVMYEEDYGLDSVFDDFIVCFAHTGDNLGAQSKDEIIEIYNKVAQKYPGCKLRAATLDDVAEKISTLKDLPIVTKEIGDTWIHGAGTDPQKVSRYRKLLRHIRDNGIKGDISENLLVVPEHTWGMDLKSYYKNNKDYTWREMENTDASKKIIEQSWQEQRNYVTEAEKLLGVKSDYPVAKPVISGYTEIEIPNDIGMEVSWQLFDNSDYERYKKDYMRTIVEWSIWDFTKPGLSDYKGGIFTAKPVKAYAKGDERLYILEFDKDVAYEQGLPYFYLTVKDGFYDLRWFGKKGSRLPQAIWTKLTGMTENWEISKMGTWIKADDIVGSPLISATDNGIRNGEVEIYPLDCTLVAPYGRRLLQYNVKDVKQDMYFNLYNNIWNTNFPMWYSDDGMARFEIKPVK